MKTTVDIADMLCEAAKRIATEEKTTLRELIEAGLRLEISRRQEQRSFRLPKASFRGDGLQPEFQDADWSRLRQAAYEERGG